MSKRTSKYLHDLATGYCKDEDITLWKRLRDSPDETVLASVDDSTPNHVTALATVLQEALIRSEADTELALQALVFNIEHEVFGCDNPAAILDRCCELLQDTAGLWREATRIVDGAMPQH